MSGCTKGGNDCKHERKDQVDYGAVPEETQIGRIVLEGAQKTNKGGAAGPEKIAAYQADNDANAVHPPFVPLSLWLPFEGIP